MTTTVNLKELIQEHTKQVTTQARVKAEAFRKKQENIDKTWNDYFQELKKHSNNFKLVVKDEINNFGVLIYSLNPDGSLNYSSGRTKVCDISVPYKSYEIFYDVELPNNTTKPKVIVENHVTYNRRGITGTDHGLKMRVKMGWNEPKNYYKTGKKIFEIIDGYVQGVIKTHESEIRRKNITSEAVRILTEKYPNSKLEVMSSGCGIKLTQPNRTEIKLTYRMVGTEVKFNILEVKINNDSIDVDNLINKIGNL